VYALSQPLLHLVAYHYYAGDTNMWTEDLSLLMPEDFLQLIDDQVSESETREYKQELPSGGDDDKREFLYDIASLANTRGGFLIFGITEKRDSSNKPTGIAGGIAPLESANISAEVARLENMIRDGISPRLAGIISNVIAMPQGNVLVLSVPQSWSAPHMVTFKQVNKFYGRVSSGKYLMSVDELRRAFSQSGALRDSIIAFHRHRVALLKKKSGPLPLDTAPTMVMHLVPASAFNARSITSTWKVSPERRLQMFCPTSSSPSHRYNADGLLKWVDMGNGNTTGYTQLFRNGIIEYVSACFSWNAQGTPDTSSAIFTTNLERDIADGYQDALKTYAELHITDPLFAIISLFGISGRRMYLGPRAIRSLPLIHSDEFESPDILIDPEEPMAALEILADLLWQVGGLEDSPLQKDGKWDPYQNL